MELTDSVAPSYPPSEKAPYSRNQLALLGLLVPIIGVTCIAIVNWRRLKRSDRIPLTLALTILCLAVGEFFIILLVLTLARSPSLPGLYLNFQLSNVPFILLMNKWQQSQYQRWIVSHGDAQPTFAQRGGISNLFAIVIVAYIVGAIYILTVRPFILNNIFSPLINASQPAQTFSDPAFELTYAGSWYTFNLAEDPNYAPTCQQAECVLALNHRQGIATFLILRFSNTTLREETLESAMKIIADSIQNQFPDVEVSPTKQLTLNGQDMLQQIFYSQSSQGEFREMFVLTRQADGSLLQFQANTLRNGDQRFEQEINTVLESIRFK